MGQARAVPPRLPSCQAHSRLGFPSLVRHPPGIRQVRKTKPELRCCPECGARVGLSAESVRVHLRLKHAELHLEGLSGPPSIDAVASPSAATARSSRDGAELLSPRSSTTGGAPSSVASPAWRAASSLGDPLSPRGYGEVAEAALPMLPS